MTKEDYIAVLEATRNLMENIKTQNEKYAKTLRYYASDNKDGGKAAREALRI